jgi:hypothetical protein
MLRYFLERSQEDRTALFQDLAVWKDDRARAHFQRYPVISLTFKDVKAATSDSTLKAVRAVLVDAFQKHRYLLEEGYKDAAAVIAGGVLEEHLRKLCARHGIAISVSGRPKKTEAMNSDLATAAAISKLDQKNVTAWLDLRNKSAHARYSEYSQPQVELLVQGIQDFITRVPA